MGFLDDLYNAATSALSQLTTTTQSAVSQALSPISTGSTQQESASTPSQQAQPAQLASDIYSGASSFVQGGITTLGSIASPVIATPAALIMTNPVIAPVVIPAAAAVYSFMGEKEAKLPTGATVITTGTAAIDPNKYYAVEFLPKDQSVEGGADWSRVQVVKGLALIEPSLTKETLSFQTGTGSTYAPTMAQDEGPYTYLGAKAVTQHGETNVGWLFRSTKDLYFLAQPPQSPYRQSVTMSGGEAAYSNMLVSGKAVIEPLITPIGSGEIATIRTPEGTSIPVSGASVSQQGIVQGDIGTVGSQAIAQANKSAQEIGTPQPATAQGDILGAFAGGTRAVVQGISFGLIDIEPILTGPFTGGRTEYTPERQAFQTQYSQLETRQKELLANVPAGVYQKNGVWQIPQESPEAVAWAGEIQSLNQQQETVWNTAVGKGILIQKGNEYVFAPSTVYQYGEYSKWSTGAAEQLQQGIGITPQQVAVLGIIGKTQPTVEGRIGAGLLTTTLTDPGEIITAGATGLVTGGLFRLVSWGGAATGITESLMATRAAPIVRYGPTAILGGLFVGSEAYSITEGFTQFEPRQVEFNIGREIPAATAMLGGFMVGYSAPDLVRGATRSAGDISYSIEGQVFEWQQRRAGFENIGTRGGVGLPETTTLQADYTVISDTIIGKVPYQEPQLTGRTPGYLQIESPIGADIYRQVYSPKDILQTRGPVTINEWGIWSREYSPILTRQGVSPEGAFLLGKGKSAYATSTYSVGTYAAMQKAMTYDWAETPYFGKAMFIQGVKGETYVPYEPSMLWQKKFDVRGFTIEIERPGFTGFDLNKNVGVRSAPVIERFTIGKSPVQDMFRTTKIARARTLTGEMVEIKSLDIAPKYGTLGTTSFRGADKPMPMLIEKPKAQYRQPKYDIGKLSMGTQETLFTKGRPTTLRQQIGQFTETQRATIRQRDFRLASGKMATEEFPELADILRNRGLSINEKRLIFGLAGKKVTGENIRFGTVSAELTGQAAGQRPQIGIAEDIVRDFGKSQEKNRRRAIIDIGETVGPDASIRQVERQRRELIPILDTGIIPDTAQQQRRRQEVVPITDITKLPEPQVPTEPVPWKPTVPVPGILPTLAGSSSMTPFGKKGAFRFKEVLAYSIPKTLWSLGRKVKVKGGKKKARRNK